MAEIYQVYPVTLNINIAIFARANTTQDEILRKTARRFG